MMDSLSIESLLRLIEPIGIDAEIYRRCVEAERLSRQRKFEQADVQARTAIEIAARADDARTTGIAFLYLAAIRHVSSSKADRDRAPLDCETAIRWLRQDNHHLALAEAICARMHDVDGRPREAIEHYKQANRILGKLIEQTYRQDDRDKHHTYDQLHRAITAYIRRIEFGAPIIAPAAEPQPAPGTPGIPPQPVQPQPAPPPPPSPVVSAPAQPAPQAPPPVTLPHPTRLIWSASEPVRLEAVQTLDLLPTAVAGSDGAALGIAGSYAIEVSRVSIAGKPYVTHRIGSPPGDRDSLRLHPDRFYWLYAVARNGDDIGQDSEYVLVRQQEHPDMRGQMVVALEPKKNRVWVIEDGSENDIRIIGGWGERQWDIRDGSESTQYIYESLRIIGVVEALLVPIKAEPKPPEPMPVPEELFDIIDDLRRAEGFHARVDEGLRLIRYKCYQYLAKTFGIEPIPIVAGKTPFDSMLHEADNHADDPSVPDDDPSVPDGTILKVMRDGYRRQGTVIRAAYVRVNRRQGAAPSAPKP